MIGAGHSELLIIFSSHLAEVLYQLLGDQRPGETVDEGPQLSESSLASVFVRIFQKFQYQESQSGFLDLHFTHFGDRDQRLDTGFAHGPGRVVCQAVRLKRDFLGKKNR